MSSKEDRIEEPSLVLKPPEARPPATDADIESAAASPGKAEVAPSGTTRPQTALQFRGANLAGQCFDRQTLIGADFSGALLDGATFCGATLNETRFDGASVRAVDFSGARGLIAGRFAGANLSMAILPDSVSFAGPVARLDATAQTAKVVFLTLFTACIYCLLTAATTTDQSLISNTASTPLPIVDTPVPIAIFFWIAPVFLLFAYVWLHTYMQRVWTEAALLPRRLPSGEAASEIVTPWIPLSVAFERPVGRGGGRAGRFRRLETVLSIIALWLFVPLTMAVIALRYLPRHDALGSAFQLMAMSLAIGVSVMFWFSRKQGQVADGQARARGWRLPLIACGATAVTAAVTVPMALAVTGFVAVPPMPPEITALFERGRQAARLDLAGREIAERPAGWHGGLGGNALRDVLSQIPPVRLVERNMDDARLSGAFMARVVLDDTSLRRATAAQTVLQQASLVGADLSDALLPGADLRDADLTVATLVNTDFGGANLRGACFEGAAMARVRLSDADLSGADLSGAFDLNPVALADAFCDDRTKLPAGIRSSVCRLHPANSPTKELEPISALIETGVTPRSCR